MAPEEVSSRVFDYVIVGGGTAGLVVAARLSEDPSVTVGVIEAGEWHPDAPGINIPGMMGSVIGNPQFDWAFMTVPQRHANNRPIFQPRGKGLGGSSLVRPTCRTRRTQPRLQNSLEALGNKGWNWQEFLKYFKKAETTLPPSDLGPEHKLEKPSSEWHGESGPVVKGYPTRFVGHHTPFTQAFEEIGIPRNPDSASCLQSDGNNIGSATVICSIDARTATRCHSGIAYYAPNAARKNLVVLTKSHAARIVFSPGSSPLTATGVEFLHEGKTYVAQARKEVILSAGAFQTPQVLELSGIGKKEVLSQHGIETLVDLPGVGENLREWSLLDHPFVTTSHEMNDEYESIDLIAQDPQLAAKQFELYAAKQGVLSTTPAALCAFIPPKTIATEERLQQWKEKAAQSVQNAPPGLKKQLELQLQWLLDPSSAVAELAPFAGFYPGSGITPTPKVHYSSMICCISHPFSRGSVHIASADPTAPPAIDANFFANPLDLDILLAVLKTGLKLYETAPVRGSVVRQFCPTPEQSASDEALIEYIKNHCSCLYHPLGSASMLPREDGGVVDPTLKVYGTANVRVVSVFFVMSTARGANGFGASRLMPPSCRS
ncbi:GMC oxidoreductase [Earliella scabrosa]|nr:GMC oxidoreductase [Earliella scabrosa]